MVRITWTSRANRTGSSKPRRVPRLVIGRARQLRLRLRDRQPFSTEGPMRRIGLAFALLGEEVGSINEHSLLGNRSRPQLSVALPWWRTELRASSCGWRSAGTIILGRSPALAPIDPSSAGSWWPSLCQSS